MFDRQRFINDLRRLESMNVRWLHQGFSPETGMDCIGCLRWAVEEQGLRLPQELLDEWVYGRPPNGNRLLRIMRKWFAEIAAADLSPSDLIVFFMRRNPQHVAALIEDRVIGEAFESVGVSKFLIRPIPNDYRIAACFRFPDFV